MAITDDIFETHTIKYDNNKYNFKKLLQELFEINDLEKLIDPDFDKCTLPNNDKSKYHKIFYKKLNSNWEELISLYEKIIKEIIFKVMKCDFVYQKTPTLRLHYCNNQAVPEFHKDSQQNYDHPIEEINFILPITEMKDSSTICIETNENTNEFKSYDVNTDEILIFKGSKLLHGNKVNTTGKTRISFDFRIMPYYKYNLIDNIKTSQTCNKKFIINDYYKKLQFYIYFPPLWGFTSKQLLDDYKRQTPNETAIWNNFICGTDNINKADILIIQDQCTLSELNKFPLEKRYYFSREAMDRNSYHQFKPYGFIDCSFWNNKESYLWTKWIYNNKNAGGIGKTYDQLINLPPPNKTKKICCILSNKTNSPGHLLRTQFMQKLSQIIDIDIYGTVKFANCSLENNDKFECLSQYEYCMAFDNQDDIVKFFGTQFTDSVLSYTVPIYWGGSNDKLPEYFPLKSFETINIKDNKSIDKVIDILNSNNYNQRIEDLKTARNLILNKYNMWPTIEAEIYNNYFSS